MDWARKKFAQAKKINANICKQCDFAFMVRDTRLAALGCGDYVPSVHILLTYACMAVCVCVLCLFTIRLCKRAGIISRKSTRPRD